jgi:hypothetical protein
VPLHRPVLKFEIYKHVQRYKRRAQKIVLRCASKYELLINIFYQDGNMKRTRILGHVTNMGDKKNSWF